MKDCSRKGHFSSPSEAENRAFGRARVQNRKRNVGQALHLFGDRRFGCIVEDITGLVQILNVDEW